MRYDPPDPPHKACCARSGLRNGARGPPPKGAQAGLRDPGDCPGALRRCLPPCGGGLAGKGGEVVTTQAASTVSCAAPASSTCSCDRLPLETAIGGGKLFHVEPIELTTGGMVSNAGIAMARLGMKVAAFSYVGTDQWASVIRHALPGGRNRLRTSC